MTVKLGDGRECTIILCGGEFEDDIQIAEATYDDTGLDVSDDDLDWIYDNCQDKMYEEYMKCRSAAAYDRYKDWRKYGDT